MSEFKLTPDQKKDWEALVAYINDGGADSLYCAQQGDTIGSVAIQPKFGTGIGRRVLTALQREGLITLLGTLDNRFVLTDLAREEINRAANPIPVVPTSEAPIMTRFGSPVTIVGAELEALRHKTTGKIQAHNLWVKVKYEDGKEREFGVWDLRAPGGLAQIMEEIYRVAPALRDEQF